MYAPFFYCSCCGKVQFYVDTGGWSSGGALNGQHWYPKYLCAACGGKYVETR
jgi:hypothetical protein